MLNLNSLKLVLDSNLATVEWADCAALCDVFFHHLRHFDDDITKCHSLRYELNFNAILCVSF